MDERLVKLLLFMGATITLAWFLTLVVFPLIRIDYRTPPEVNVAMSGFVLSLFGVIGGAYIKSLHPQDENQQDKGKDKQQRLDNPGGEER